MQEGKRSRGTDDRFSGKVVAVTGGAVGIGWSIARAFADEGAFVFICDVNEVEGKRTEAEFCRDRLHAKYLCVDLMEKGAPQTMIRRIFESQARLDILINNARAGRRTNLFDEAEDTWEEAITVMLRAAFFASQEAIHVMAQNDGGTIVNISSIAAVETCHESPAYHIAKAGLLQMTRYLAAHSGIYGVRVNALLPGFIVKDKDRAYYHSDDNQRYRMIAEFCHPLGQVGRCSDVANAVLFLCSPEASFISGQCLMVDGGLSIQEQSGLVFRFDRERH